MGKKEKIGLEKLSKFLWAAADLMRGSIDSSDYKHYIFGLLFLKRLSDQFEDESKKIKEEGNDPEESYNYQFFVPKKARWSEVRKVTEGVGNAIDKAFAALEEQNEALEGVLTPIIFEDTKKIKDDTVKKLVKHFSNKEFNLANSNLAEPDILGRAYEYLIAQFADDAGKKGGEFYTPHGVVQTLVKILNPKEGMKICDPACGSGGMLIECVRHLHEKNKNFMNISLFGEEFNRNTWAIAKMNLLLHNILDANIKHGDTMQDPFIEHGSLMRFDIVIANPMWNQKEWSREYFESTDKTKCDPYGRAKYGIPPKSSGDWMWVQHMYSTLNEKGRMGIVLDNGSLFRGNSEGDIRKELIKDDLIEGIIALPANLFQNTGSPGCLIIINKNKPEEMKNKIFFIHAENEYKEGKAQNYLKEEHIKKISDIYHRKEVVAKFSEIVGKDDIKENSYNLNVSRYVDILEEEAPIDIENCINNINQIRKERLSLEKTLSQNLSDLGFKEFK